MKMIFLKLLTKGSSSLKIPCVISKLFFRCFGQLSRAFSFSILLYSLVGQTVRKLRPLIGRLLLDRVAGSESSVLSTLVIVSVEGQPWDTKTKKQKKKGRIKVLYDKIFQNVVKSNEYLSYSLRYLVPTTGNSKLLASPKNNEISEIYLFIQKI